MQSAVRQQGLPYQEPEPEPGQGQGQEQGQGEEQVLQQEP